MSIAHIAFIVLSDERRVMTVSTCARGFAGVKQDVFLSLPCVVGASGVTQIMEMPLTDEERKLFQQSAEATWAVQEGIWSDL
jgi:L-lactate dehydrogenase